MNQFVLRHVQEHDNCLSYYSQYLNRHIQISYIHKLRNFLNTAEYLIWRGEGGVLADDRAKSASVPLSSLYRN